MSILTVIITLLIFAAAFYLIARYVEAGTLRTFLLAAVAIVLLVWLLSVTGVWSGLHRDVR